jgi:hypothetical protein
MPDIDALKRAQQAKSQRYGYVLTQTNDPKQQAAAKQDMMDANDAYQRALMQQQQAPVTSTTPSAVTSPNPGPNQPVAKARGGAVRRQFRW